LRGPSAIAELLVALIFQIICIFGPGSREVHRQSGATATRFALPIESAPVTAMSFGTSRLWLVNYQSILVKWPPRRGVVVSRINQPA